MPLILASSSSIRRAMLDAAGVNHSARPSTIEEAAIKDPTRNAGQIASMLAEAKAMDVGQANPGDWVIGSDSVVSVEGRRFDKPTSRDNAAEHLRFFSGKMMELTSAVALARGDKVDWTHCDTAYLKVRELSDAFIDSYLDEEWPEVGYCVGVFRMEGRGVQLFEEVKGSHFTILGMPLIPLLGALRERGLIAA